MGYLLAITIPLTIGIIVILIIRHIERVEHDKLRNWFVAQTKSETLGYGYLWLYSDPERTKLATVFKDEKNELPWPNPIALNSRGDIDYFDLYLQEDILLYLKWTDQMGNRVHTKPGEMKIVRNNKKKEGEK